MSGEAYVVTGFDAIVNYDNVKPGVDVKSLERMMINGGIVTQKAKERDPADKLNDALAMAARKLGIDFDDVATDQSSQPQPQSTPARTATPLRPVTPARAATPMQPTGTQSTPLRAATPPRPVPEPIHYEADSDDSDHGDYAPPEYAASSTSPYARGNVTMEQQRRTHIDSVVGSNRATFSIENEKREDAKCAMLAEIDSLINSLTMEEVKLDRIQTVDTKSSYEEVESTLKVLRHKNDQARCCTFAEEIMMFAAYAVEELFDGKQVWFGRWSPDLTGWHNNLQVKVKRIRYDTGLVVGGFMDAYNIGPGTRMALEILPNMFLYSKMKKQQQSQPSLADMEISQSETEAASARIRSLQ